MKQSQYTVKDSKDNRIDLTLLWQVFVGNLWKILLVAVLAAGLLGAVRYFTTSNTYTSRVKFLISGMTLTKIGDEYTYIYNGSNASSQAASQFAMNAPAIIGEDNTLEKVRNYLVTEKGDGAYGEIYRNFTNRSIAAMLDVSYDEQIVVVSVTHVDEKIALDVAEAFRNMVPGQMDYYYGIENKYSSSDSRRPLRQSSSAMDWEHMRQGSSVTEP